MSNNVFNCNLTSYMNNAIFKVSMNMKEGAQMRISTRFSDAIHILAYLDIFHDQKLSSENISASVMTSPVVIRRIMGKLQKAGLITTTYGFPNPHLARKPEDITLLDVFNATEKNKELFSVDPHTNPKCPVGGHIQDVLTNYYHEAQNAALGRLDRITIADVIDDILVANKEE